MTDKIVTKELDKSLAGFVDNLNEAATMISHKLISVAPEAAHLLLQAIQLRAIVDELTGFIGLGVGIFVLSKITPRLLKASKDADSYSGEETGYAVCAVLSGIGGALLMFISLLSALSTHTIVAIFSPQAALALQAIDKITN